MGPCSTGSSRGHSRCRHGNISHCRRQWMHVQKQLVASAHLLHTQHSPQRTPPLGQVCKAPPPPLPHPHPGGAGGRTPPGKILICVFLCTFNVLSRHISVSRVLCLTRFRMHICLKVSCF